jgi:hypothetical protein
LIGGELIPLLELIELPELPELPNWRGATPFLQTLYIAQLGIYSYYSVRRK